MTLHRKRRLRALIAGSPYHGSQLEFAKAVGLTEGRISQLVDDSQSFGERSARRVANELRLDDRYFELEFETAAVPREVGAPPIATTSVSHDLQDLKGLTPEELHALLLKHVGIVEKLTRALGGSPTLSTTHDSQQSNMPSKAGRNPRVSRQLGKAKERGESDSAAQPAARRAKGVG